MDRVGSTSEHERALPLVPPSQERLLRFDNTTKTFESLKTKDRAEATRLLPKTFFEELSTFHRLPESDTVTTRRPCFRVDNHLRRWPK
jgi:hypothetical protein